MSDIKRRCSRCGAHTTIDGVSFCWKCREKLPTRTSAAARKAISRGIGQAAVAIFLFGVVAATFWWALQ